MHRFTPPVSQVLLRRLTISRVIDMMAGDASPLLASPMRDRPELRLRGTRPVLGTRLLAPSWTAPVKLISCLVRMCCPPEDLARRAPVRAAP